MNGRTKRTPEKEAEFLAALSETANVTHSCEVTGIARASAYEWREADEGFKAKWDAALVLGTDALEDEAIRRAKVGTLKPVFYQGEECGTIREYSDTLMIVMLKSRRPEKFKERHEHSGPGGGPMVFQTINYGTEKPDADHHDPV